MLSLPFNITCGYCDCSEFGSLSISPKRKTTKFEIEFYLEEGFSTFADDKEYKIHKWHIQIAKPGQIRYSHLPFKTLYFKFSAKGELKEKLLAAPEYFSSSHPEQITEKFDELILLTENPNNELLLYSRVLSFLNLVLRDSEIPHTQSGNSYGTISKAKRYIESNFSKPIHLEDIAAAVNLSPIYFHNIFKAACGQSPHDYLIKCRIAEAKKLLWDTTVTLTQVAESCGFGCQQYFNKIFKEQTGISPGKYRKQVQQNYLEE